MAYIYTNGAWAVYDPYKYGVNTTTFTTFPFTVKSPTTPVNATIYGNMAQSGTPTPAAPINPKECGDLETTGEHANQYKIPISSNNTTTNVYIGEVQTTRKIGKRILDGTENWIYRTGEPSNIYFINLSPLGITAVRGIGLSNAYTYVTGGTYDSLQDGEFIVGIDSFGFRNTQFSSAVDFKAYIAQQYAAGTPVTVWYVLASETTGIVNEPIRKIGDYADSVTSSIPVTINSDSVDITTTLKPSAVAAPSLSWGTGDDYKYSDGSWS